MAGFVMLGVAAVATVVGLVSLAGGGDQANAAPAAGSSATSSGAPAPSGLAMAPPAPAAPPAAPRPPISVPAQPPEPPAAAPAQTPAATPTTKPLPGAGLPPAGRSAGRSAGRTGENVPRAKPTARAPVRVYNNSKVRDLAQQAATDFRDSGWQVNEVGNYPNGTVGASTVYYRPGTGEQAAAEALASSFGLRAAPRFAGIAGASPGLIVIVTRDYQRR
jgi:hypothetical protein